MMRHIFVIHNKNDRIYKINVSLNSFKHTIQNNLIHLIDAQTHRKPVLYFVKTYIGISVIDVENILIIVEAK
jgi:hypothetical protein